MVNVKLVVRTISPILLIGFFFIGCANFPVVVQKDPFKGVTGVSVDMWHTVLDSDLDNIRTSYHKNIDRGETTDPVATIVFVAVVDPYYGTYHGEDLSREAYIMVDSRLFPVDLIENKNVRMKQNSVILYDYSFYGYPPFYYYYPGPVIVRETSRRILTAKIRLTPDIQKALAGAFSYKIRLYAGEVPVTLEATPRQLEALKKFLVYGSTGDR